EDEEAETDLEVSEQKIHQGALQGQFFGRGMLLSSAVEKGLPQSLSLLVQYSLERLCIQYRDIPGLRLTLAVLTVSNSGKVLQEFSNFLCICRREYIDGQVTWEEVLQLSRKPEGRIPMAVFTLDPEGHLENCRSFLKRHASTLSPWPALFVQQALNEPSETSAHIWAEGLSGPKPDSGCYRRGNAAHRPRADRTGEVRVWSVSTSTCVGCFQAHRGATETLTFLEEGSMLLSAGSDHTIMGPPQKKAKCVASEPAALCVAVNGDYAAVGYHGETIWVSTDLSVSVHCLLWIHADPHQSKPELLVSGGSDKRLRLWRKNEGEEELLEGLIHLKTFGVQTDGILAMVQSSTVLATASGKRHMKSFYPKVHPSIHQGYCVFFLHEIKWF
ncbi:hypothetical protein XENOCAPTIV_004653, partial [Xenoophorus captivus]